MTAMTFNKLIGQAFVGKVILSIEEFPVNKLIKKATLMNEDGHSYILLTYNDDTKTILWTNTPFVLV